jgi:cobalt/nickel transport system permease protein
MHIYEGVLSVTAHGQELLAAGALVAAAGTAVGLRKLDPERLPRIGLLSATFFVASLVQIPLGPSSVHLVLSGLMGLILGWAAFPAILIALTLQVVFFSIGGPTTLGINTVIMAVPAVVCHYLFRRTSAADSEWLVFGAGFAAGATALILGALITTGILILAGKEFSALAPLILAVHLPSAVVEGFVTGGIVVFIRKVRPELLDAPRLVTACEYETIKEELL